LRTHGHLLCTAYRYTSYGAYVGGRTAFLTSHSQGFSAIALFGSLLTGSALFSMDNRETDPKRLCQWLREERITFLAAPPGILRAIGAMDIPVLGDLVAVCTGMEPLSRRDVVALGGKLPLGCPIIFQFGASEGNVSHFIVRNGEEWEGDSTPAGYPDFGHEVIIADEEMRPVPPGKVGQICVRSRFVSLGYWNDPDETRRRFIRDPLDPRSRTWLSGDLGLLRDDGLLEHRGRMDFMLKIRGHRIEPEMIERILDSHPAVAESAVVAAPSRNGESRLVAYCAFREAASISSTDLREHLLKSLPPHMVPARFVFLDSLPRGLSGKVDRAALPPPGSSRPDLSAPFVEPSDGLEKELAELWCEILGLDEVGRDDDFFLLGGDSLSALELSFRAEGILGHSLPPSIFRSPTIAVMAVAPREDPAPDAEIEPRPEGSGPADPPSESGPSRRSIRGAAMSKLFSTAQPLGLALPLYRCLVGAVSLRAAASLSRLRRDSFSSIRALYVALARELGLDLDPEELVRTALASQTAAWSFGNGTFRLDRADLRRLLEFEGEEELKRSLESRGAAVCVSWHSTLYRLNSLVFEELGIKTVGVFPPKPAGMSRSDFASGNAVILQNAAVLMRSGAVARILPDGDRGTRGLTRDFLGRTRAFYPGFAELAVLERVPVHGLSIELRKGGRVRCSFGPAFAGGGPTRREGEVEALLLEYIRYLEDRWRSAPGEVRMKDVREYLERTGPFSSGISEP
jgi:hypothetical protein